MADHQSSLGVNAHAIGATALFRTIAGACVAALTICRGFRSPVDEIVVAITFTAVFHPGHTVSETSAGGNAFLHRQRRIVSLPVPQNAAIEVVDVAALVGPTRWESWTCSLGDKSGSIRGDELGRVRTITEGELRPDKVLRTRDSQRAEEKAARTNEGAIVDRIIKTETQSRYPTCSG